MALHLLTEEASEFEDEFTIKIIRLSLSERYSKQEQTIFTQRD
jgi:hypothetical protein